MEHILLVEPNYNNKYPPIGLMKISTYHKSKGDYVEFYKGKAPYNLITKMDRIYITSLFTFHFDVTVDTINHYTKYIDCSKVFAGGIAVTLMKDKFEEKTGHVHFLTGQLTSSKILGYNDDINIDILPLDYDILDDVEYDYGVTDNFFAYSTRGCPRKCHFCAVKTLEPCFANTNNLKAQITFVRETYGDKRNIMMMDNNVIFSDELENICEDLYDLGFQKDKFTYIPPNLAVLFYKKIDRRIKQGLITWKVENAFYAYLQKFATRVKKDALKEQFDKLITDLSDSKNRLDIFFANSKFIIETVEKYRSKKPLQRYVDFNQGLDARLLTDEKMKILSKLPLRPFRLAYDDISSTDQYIKAFELAYKYGVRHFSNYMLFNFNDTPEDLWERAHNNIILYSRYPDVSAFSFPMKYAPIDRTDREYIGKHWNKKFLSAINIILNVTKGVVAKEEDFFERAYGKTSEEFILILSMPTEFIKYRTFFENNGLINAWKKTYNKLRSKKEKREFLDQLMNGEVSPKYSDVLKYYRITKHQVSSGKVDISNYI